MVSLLSSWPTLEAGNLLALLLIFWRLSRAAGAMERIIKDFPPHRHIAGEIVYPAGYSPGSVQSDQGIYGSGEGQIERRRKG